MDKEIGKDCLLANLGAMTEIKSPSTSTDPIDLMATIGENLRKVRRKQGLTLAQVEERSNGEWKAVVIGSYERNDRSLSLKKAIELAQFYQIPIDQLLGISNSSMNSGTSHRVILDLRRLRNYSQHFEDLAMVSQIAAFICAKRRDWNGEILSLRESDQATLALISFASEEEILRKLQSASVLFFAEN